MLQPLLVCFDSALDNPLDMLNQPREATADGGAIDVDGGGVDDEDCSAASDTALNHVLLDDADGMRNHGMGWSALVVAAGGWTRYESHVDESLGPGGGGGGNVAR